MTTQNTHPATAAVEANPLLSNMFAALTAANVAGEIPTPRPWGTFVGTVVDASPAKCDGENTLDGQRGILFKLRLARYAGETVPDDDSFPEHGYVTVFQLRRNKDTGAAERNPIYDSQLAALVADWQTRLPAEGFKVFDGSQATVGTKSSKSSNRGWDWSFPKEAYAAMPAADLAAYA